MRFLILGLFIVSHLNAGPILDEARLSLPPEREILSLIEELENCHVVEGISFDQILMIQIAIEKTLAKHQEEGKIQEFLGIIHSEMPALSFCRKPKQLSHAGRGISCPLISQEMIYRKYLKQGGKLMVVYPQGGLEKRSSVEQEIYQEALREFSPNLIDWTLATNDIDSKLIGITYLFLDQEYELYGLSFDKKSICFGPITQPEIQKRFDKIFGYFSKVGGPEI